MSDILLILSLLYVFKSLLMTSLLPNKWLVAGFTAVCAGFVWLTHGYALEQNKLALQALFEGQKILTDVSLVVMADLMLTVAFVQSVLQRETGIRKNAFWRFMGCIPPILLLPALYYAQVNLFFSFVGVDFTLLTAVLSGAALVVIPAGTTVVKYLLPAVDLRIELTALLELLIFVLVICCTIFHPSAILYTDGSPIDYKSLGLTVGIVVAFFGAGLAWNKIKTQLKRNKKA